MTGYHCHLQGVLHSGQSIAIIVGLVPPPGCCTSRGDSRGTPPECSRVQSIRILSDVMSRGCKVSYVDIKQGYNVLFIMTYQ